MKRPYPVTTNATVGGNMDVVYALADGDLGRAFLVEPVPEFRFGTWTLLSWQMEEIRRHRGRYLVFGGVSYRGESDGRIRTAEIVTKVHKKGPGGDQALRALCQLWDAGFRAPGPYRVPRLSGCLPERNTMIQERVREASWADLLEGGEQTPSQASMLAAEWLLQRQSCGGRGWRGGEGAARQEQISRESGPGEPTTGLDAESEETVMRALDRLMQGRTTLMIAQKLSTLRRSIRIYVLEAGEIAEEGTHGDLMNRGGR